MGDKNRGRVERSAALVFTKMRQRAGCGLGFENPPIVKDVKEIWVDVEDGCCDRVEKELDDGSSPKLASLEANGWRAAPQTSEYRVYLVRNKPTHSIPTSSKNPKSPPYHGKC